MADNIDVKDAATTTRTVAADEINSALYQRVKLVHGADGVNAGDIATGNPLPVVQTGTPALATGAATEVTLAALLAELAGKLEAGDSIDVGNFPADPATQTTLAAVAASLVTIAGHVDLVEAKLDTVIAAVGAATPAGTNNIGDVDVASLPGTLAADVTAIKAAAETIDNAISGSEMQVDVVTMPTVNVQATDLDVRFMQRDGDAVAVALQTDAIMEGTTALVPKSAKIDAASSGDNTLVAAVASKKIKVLSLVFQAGGTVNVTFKSGAGTALSGPLPQVANSGLSSGFDPTGHLETAAGAALVMNLSAAVQVSGWLKYVEAA